MHIVKLIACIVMGIASVTLARAREPVAIDRAADSPLTNASPLEIMGRILPSLERKIESRCALLIEKPDLLPIVHFRENSILMITLRF